MACFANGMGLLSEQVIECLAASMSDQPGFRDDAVVQPLDQPVAKPQRAGPGVRCLGSTFMRSGELLEDQFCRLSIRRP